MMSSVRAIFIFMLLIGSVRADDSIVREESGLVAVHRGQVHYRLWRLASPPAAPRPLLVYFHGGPGGNGSVFRQAVGGLLTRKVGDVLFVDQRGAGRSPTGGLVTGDFTLARFADDARRAIAWVATQHPDLGKPVIIGHSLGAGIAVLFARAYPKALAKLVLLSPAVDFRDVKYHGYLAMKQRARREGDAAQLERIRALEAQHPPGSATEAELFAAALSGARFDHAARRFAGAEEADLHRILSAREGEPVRVAETWARFAEADQLDRKDLTSELPGLALPVLVIGGAEDYLTPPGTLTQIAGMIPNAALKLMPAAGHHPYLLAPEAFVEHLAAFVQR
jgi:proline iminopeptidase